MKSDFNLSHIKKFLLRTLFLKNKIGKFLNSEKKARLMTFLWLWTSNEMNIEQQKLEIVLISNFIAKHALLYLNIPPILELILLDLICIWTFLVQKKMESLSISHDC